MYEAFYGLREKPFNLTPDPRFLYLSEKHKEAFAHLLYGIKNRSGFVMVSGEIGTGKTTICRTLLNQLDQNTEVAFIFNPYLSPVELLKSIVSEFGVRSASETTVGLIGDLNRYLLKAATADKNCVLVIDEAQNLAPQVLEQIRLLSNLETDSQKLLQIVLIGQPELAEMLALNELRQLNQRITARYHLNKLGFDETLQYIAYRLRVAGGRKKVRFTKSAVKKVYRLSGGTPRVINALCDRALLIGYTKETREITPAIIRQAARETQGPKVRAAKTVHPSGGGRLLVRAAVAALVVAAVVAGTFTLQQRGMFETATAPAPNPAPEGETAAENGISLIKPAEAAVRDPGASDPVAAAIEGDADSESHAEAAGEVAIAEPEAPANPILTQLAGLEPDATRHAAAAAILRLWNQASLGDAPEGDTVEDFLTFAANNGFEAEVLEGGLEAVLTLGYPGFIRCGSGDTWRWVALVEANDETATLTASGDDVMEVTREELAEAALDGEAVVPWRDPAPEAYTLRRSSSGAVVSELQAQLHAIGLLEEEPTGRFGSSTEAAVRALQEKAGLKADGVAGRQTRMVLTSWVPISPAPSLKPRPVPADDVLALLNRTMKEPAAAVASAPEPTQEASPAPEEAPEPKAAPVEMAESEEESPAALMPDTIEELTAPPAATETEDGPADADPAAPVETEGQEDTPNDEAVPEGTATADSDDTETDATPAPAEDTAAPQEEEPAETGAESPDDLDAPSSDETGPAVESTDLAPLAPAANDGAEGTQPEPAGTTAPVPAEEVVSSESGIGADEAPEPVSKSYPDEVTAPALGVAPLVPAGGGGEETR